MKLPSVTQIIKPYVDTDWFLPEHAERGTAVHAASLSYVQGLWVPPLLPAHQPYYDSFQRWADMAIDKVILVEERLVDPKLGFTGRPDLICIIKGDSLPSLPDIKTGQAYQIYWRLQAAAYRHLAVTAKGIHTHRAFSVRTKADGSGCLTRPEYPKDYRGDFNIFLGLLNAFRYFSK